MPPRTIVMALAAALAAATASASEPWDTVEAGDAARLRSLLDGDPACAHRVDAEGDSLLHTAAARGHVEIARMLIEAGVDVDRAGLAGRTPLSFAAREGHADMVRFLLDHGADTSARGPWGFTPLLLAVQRNREDVVEILLDRGACPDLRDRRGDTALVAALRRGRLEVAGSLVAHGADVNAAGEHGRSPLHALAVRAPQGAVELLLSCGADVNARDAVGRTPLHLAAARGRSDTAALLMAHGADTAIRDDDGMTPRATALRYGWRELAAAVLGSDRDGSVLPDRPPRLAAPATGQARVVYLGHSGWAVRTARHLLVFDYWQRDPVGPDSSLVNGHIVPEELAGVDTVVFVTHVHRDHWDDTVFSWRRAGATVRYVFGFSPEEHTPDLVMEPWQRAELDGIALRAVPTNDGVGFFVRTDGLTLFHSGDFGFWSEETRHRFERALGFLMGSAPGYDLAFFNGRYDLGLDSPFAAANAVARALEPAIAFPMHYGDAEYVLGDFARQAPANEITSTVFCPDHPGDSVTFRGRP